MTNKYRDPRFPKCLVEVASDDRGEWFQFDSIDEALEFTATQTDECHIYSEETLENLPVSVWSAPANAI